VLRHTPSTFTLLAKERDTPCIPTHTAGDGNGYTLHIHRAGSGKATPCKSILLMLRWFKEIHLQIHTAGDGKRYIREAHTVGSAKRYILLLLHVHTACVAKINHAHPYCLLLTAYCYGSGAMLHPPEMNCTPLSYPAPLENDCTLLSYASPPWTMLHPLELCYILLSYTAPFWATLHPLGYAIPYWARLYPIFNGKDVGRNMNARDTIHSKTASNTRDAHVDVQGVFLFTASSINMQGVSFVTIVFL
jgi:hypothetical protein